MSLDVTRIDVKSLIPHREPFLLVDALTDYKPGIGLHAVKAVSRAEPWFQGHFPDFPVLPGVLITEALAQTCAMFMSLDDRGSDQSKDYIYVLLRTEMRHFNPVFPGTLLTLKVEKTETNGHFVYFKVSASRGEKTCARGTITVGKTKRSRMDTADEDLAHVEAHVSTP
ncbi:MAG: beta-hydroxyacyl-ACP dehydratase [Nitrospira sp.]|nr:beta-hydroxyacyl-ACP dehydratase [Nitrospira sp.]